MDRGGRLSPLDGPKVRPGAMSIKIASAVTFTDQDVEQIAKALNVDTNPDRLSLFPLVLREWAQVDLME